jgi:DNA-binding MarR family transcriptional regulator
VGPDPIVEARRQWREHGWADAEPGMAVVTSVMRVQQLLSARVEAALAPFDLSFARYELLRLLAFTQRGELPLSRVSALLQVHPTSVTNAIQRLVADGLVVRAPHPSDGRAAIAVLTDAGRERVERATPAVNGVFVDVGVEGDDAERLFQLLDRIRLAGEERIADGGSNGDRRG